MGMPKYWKIVEFPKISIKMKNYETFYEAQTTSRLNEIIQPPPPPSIQPASPSHQIRLRLSNKNFLREIYRNIQTFAFKELQECSSWASRNDAVQMFFRTPNRNMLAGKFGKWKRFLEMFPEYIIFNVKWVEVRTMSELFWAKLCCKMTDLFC